MDPTEIDWIGYVPVAIIGLEPKELASRQGLTFRDSHDDLDLLSESTFRGPLGDVFALVRHLNAPKPGTELLVKAKDLQDARRQLHDALERLQLTEADISWVSPDLGKVTIVEAKSGAMTRNVPRKASGVRNADERTPTKKSKKKKNSARPKAMNPDAALSAVVGKKPMPRTEITSKLWSYIKRKGLQDKKDQKMIRADGALLRVFNGKSKVSKLELPKLVDDHLKKVK